MILVGVNGENFAQVELSEPPIGSPIFGDFNGDGLQDIVLPGRTHLYGFKVTHRRGTAFFSYILYLLTAVLAVVFVRQATRKQVAAKELKGNRGTD